MVRPGRAAAPAAAASADPAPRAGLGMVVVMTGVLIGVTLSGAAAL